MNSNLETCETDSEPMHALHVHNKPIPALHVHNKPIPALHLHNKPMPALQVHNKLVCFLVCQSSAVLARGYKTFFSYSTQLSTKFILLINVKMSTIVGILTYICMINRNAKYNIW